MKTKWLPITTAPNSLAEILVTDGLNVWVDQKISENPNDPCEKGNYYFNGHQAWDEVTYWLPIPTLSKLNQRTLMQPTCQLIRRPLAKKSPWRKWVTNALDLLGAILAIVLLVAVLILSLAL